MKIKKTEKFTNLTKRERFLLDCLSDIVMARKLFISLKTLKLWTKLGAPHHQIGGYIYYNHQEFWDFLETPSPDGDGKIIDMLWRRTPERLLPRKNVKFGKGEYFLVPAK